MHEQASDPLLAGLAEGRDQAFAELYDRFGRSLFRVAWSLLRSRPEAEDAVQDVFLGLVRSRHTLGRIENLRAYLFGALRHAVARRAARKETSRPMSAEQCEEAGSQHSLDPELSDWLELLAIRWASRGSAIHWLWAAIVYLVFFLAADVVVMATFAVYSREGHLVRTSWFYYSLAWLLAFVLLSAAWLRRGLRRPEPGLARATGRSCASVP